MKPEAGSPFSWEKGPLTVLESSLTSQPTSHLQGLLFSSLGGPSVWPEDLLTHSLLPWLQKQGIWRKVNQVCDREKAFKGASPHLAPRGNPARQEPKAGPS